MANRLANATSPYLQQHAGNPVDWWEWGPEAFAEAKRRDTPILLSVGYAACHWCHVMAHESFEDEATAAYLNEHFVSIKVDREERPDVDAVYMQATTSMTGHGGWPMTVVLDHDGNPFFAGTYFPDAPRHGQPSFRQVLEALSDAWTNRADEVARVGAALREHLNQANALTAGTIDLDAAVATLAREFDPRSAGFGGAPKFPPSMVLEFLLRHGEREMLGATLEAMARGGIHDQLGGGFARYSVDNDWVVPHFEKMLYDNVLLLRVYAEWGTDLGERIALEVAEFLTSDQLTAQGFFEFEDFAGHLPSHRARQFQGWLQISQGCNCVCSYCIVPSTRGREQSRDPQELLLEAEKLAADGVREITLLGQNVNSYGRDLPKESRIRFSDLLGMVDAVDGVDVGLAGAPGGHADGQLPGALPGPPALLPEHAGDVPEERQALERVTGWTGVSHKGIVGPWLLHRTSGRRSSS